MVEHPVDRVVEPVKWVVHPVTCEGEPVKMVEHAVNRLKDVISGRFGWVTPSGRI